MKKFLLSSLVLAVVIVGCDNKNDSKTTAAAGSSIKLPYDARYATEFTNNVPDSSLLTVLNSYKAWENGDMTGLRSTLNDSTYFYGSGGLKFEGLTDSAMKIFTKYRDSLSTVKITMDVWLKNHSVKDSFDYINVWYKEIDTYKTGKVDS
ncbi:MAG: hypothetical protein ACJ749_16655, partial [Flavisolibacter sp.]